MTKKGRGKRAATAMKGSVVTTQTNAIKGKVAPANNRKEKVKVAQKLESTVVPTPQSEAELTEIEEDDASKPVDSSNKVAEVSA